MNKLFVLITMFAISFASLHAEAGVGVPGAPFEKIFYLSGASGSGSHSGLDAGNAKPIASTNLMAIPAGAVIENVYVIVDTAITGSTAVNVGDTDSANGYVPTAAITLGTPGLYGWDAVNAGTYKQKVSSGSVYAVPNAKYYSASGKFLTLANTTTNTGGALRVVVSGFIMR